MHTGAFPSFRTKPVVSDTTSGWSGNRSRSPGSMPTDTCPIRATSFSMASRLWTTTKYHGW